MVGTGGRDRSPFGPRARAVAFLTVASVLPWVALPAAVSFATAPGSPAGAGPVPDVAELKKSSGRFAPVDLAVDVSRLPPGERAALGRIVRAAELMDTIFLRQVWAGNETLLAQLARDMTPLGRERLHAFWLNKGPWLRLDGERPFLRGVGEKPAAGTFYPGDATKPDLDVWMKTLSPEVRASAGGFFTTIRRGLDGRFTVVPYSVEYQGELARAAVLLREAAALTEQPALRRYLETRAAAFLSNDYYPSDVAWMQLDSSIEPTIGPYEVYEDGWFSAKAAFEAFVALRDDAETEKLTRFARELQDLEDHLPIDPRLRNPKLGAMAPIRVVNSIFGAGDANRGVQTAAFNLPNDEKIEREMGTKRVMLKNVQEAKFRVVLRPIANVALAAADRKNVRFDAFFSHILMHELMHGLGPHQVTAPGPTGASSGPTGAGGAGTGARGAASRTGHDTATTVRAALQETYGAIEEAKADISGLWALGTLIDKGVLDRGFERAAYTTFLASAFRSIRFGLKEAHGRGVALQLNTLLDAGAVVVAKDGTFSIEVVRMKDAVRALTGELMTLQASGDHAQAVELLRTRAEIRPAVQRVLDRLTRVPVDIEPRFITAEKLLAAPAP